MGTYNYFCAMVKRGEIKVDNMHLITLSVPVTMNEHPSNALPSASNEVLLLWASGPYSLGQGRIDLRLINVSVWSSFWIN